MAVIQDFENDLVPPVVDGQQHQNRDGTGFTTMCPAGRGVGHEGLGIGHMAARDSVRLAVHKT